MARSEGRKTLIAIVLALYALSTLSTFLLSSAVYLYIARLVEPAISPSEILMVVSSGLSIIYLPLHQLMARRYQKAGLSYQASKILRSACFALARLMVISWIAASGAGAVKQPMCLPGNGNYAPWQVENSCIIHTTSVVASLVAFVASFVLLCSLQLPGQPFRASLSGITPCAPPARPVPTADPSLYSFISDKSLVPSSIDLEQGRIHRPSLPSAPRTAEWLHGETPILPPLPRRSYSFGLAWPAAGPDLPRQSTIYESTAYIPQPRTVPAPSIFSDISASSSYSTVSRQTSAISSRGSTGSSISRQSPLSTMHRADEPEVPVIPDKFKLDSRPLLTHGWSRPAEEAVPERTLIMPAKVAREYPSRYRRPSTSPVVNPLAVRKAKSAATLQQPHRRAHTYTHSYTHHQQQQPPYRHTPYQRPLLSRLPSYENPRPPPQPFPTYDYDTLRKGTPIFPAPSLEPSYPRHHHQPSPLALALESAVEIDTHGTDGRLYEPVDRHPNQSAILLAQARAGDTVMGRGGLAAGGGMRRKGSRTLVKRRQPGDVYGSGGGKRMGMGRRAMGSGEGTGSGIGGWL